MDYCCDLGRSIRATIFRLFQRELAECCAPTRTEFLLLRHLVRLHAKLDRLVMQAYGFKAGDDLLENLLTLNLELAKKEKRKEPIVDSRAPKARE